MKQTFTKSGKVFSQSIAKAALFRALILLVGVAGSGQSNAFSEDMCPANQGGWTSCVDRACSPQGENLFCESASALSQYVTLATGDATGVRSVLHFDSIYLLAQAVGFTPRQAYQIASYNQAVDTGKYDHRDESGQIMIARESCTGTTANPVKDPASCVLNSADISGVGRNNFVGGGLFFHFHTVPPASKSSNGLKPQVADPQREPFLNHLRNWALGKGPLCLGGMSFIKGADQLDSGAACYQSTMRAEPTLLGRIPFISELGEYLQLDWISTISEQRVVRNPQTQELTLASQLEKNLPPNVEAQYVRMGIYLHALQDRISHHRCIMSSTLEGPRPANASPILTNALVKSVYDLSIFRRPIEMLNNALAYPVVVNPEFFFEFNRMECDQLSHFQRHSFEVGIKQSTLDERDRTTEAGIRAALSELMHFAQQSGQYQPKVTGAKVEGFIQDVIAAIEESTPNQRVKKIAAVAPQYQLVPLPGHAGFSLEQWLAADSKPGVQVAEQSGPGVQLSTGDRAGGGALSWLGLIGLIALTIRLKWK